MTTKINDQRPTIVMLMAGQGINEYDLHLYCINLCSGWSVYTRAGMVS